MLIATFADFAVVRHS